MISKLIQCSITIITLTNLSVALADTLIPKYEAKARLEALHEADLSSNLQAKITAINVKPGDTFKANEPLAKLECDGIEADYEKAKADFSSVKHQYKGYKKLEKKYPSWGYEFKQAKTALIKSRAEIKKTKSALNGCIISASYPGKVYDVYGQIDEVNIPNKPIIRVVDDSKLILKLEVPSTWPIILKTGTPFIFKPYENEKEYNATVTAIGGISTDTQTIPIYGEITPRGENIQSGISGIAIFDNKRV